MATATFLTEGLSELTAVLLGNTLGIAPKLRLFSNNPTITAASTLSSFTANGLTGGADASIIPSSWSVSSSGGVASATYPTVTFTFAAYAGGTTIYGGVVYNSNSSKGYYAWLLDTAFAVPAGGGTLTIALAFSDHQC